MTKINIYRNGRVWCYAVLIDGQHDHSDTIGVGDDATETEARDEMLSQFPGADIHRVADTVE